MVDSAVRYLEHHLEKRYRPLTTAVTAYALALAGSPKAKDFNNKLLDMALTTPQGTFTWLMTMLMIIITVCVKKMSNIT